MSQITRFELFAVELPFRKPFKHAAAARTTSNSIFVKAVTDSGETGYGETLPRAYVTGETSASTFDLLAREILPRLLGRSFHGLQEVKNFLIRCDGNAPPEWLLAGRPQTAAWCAVDLVLLDTFGKVFHEPVRLDPAASMPPAFRYSPVISAGTGLEFLASLLKIRLFGFKQVKLKLGHDHDLQACRRARSILGGKYDIRVDANMAWDVEQALSRMADLSAYGVLSFEQPLAADDLTGLARLVKETKLAVMVDESLSDRASLTELIARKACTAVNVRIAKCGGLMAARARCQQASQAGLTVQLGCQTGESSLLSAAHLMLVEAVQQVTYAESCYGLFLLREDPGRPVLQFGYGGLPPKQPDGPGLGIRMDETILKRWTTRHLLVE